MSYTRLGYPAAFASEGNPLAGGKFPGDYNPYVHGVNDTMDVDDDTGFFSLDVSLMPIFRLGCVLIWAAHGEILRAGNCLRCGAGRMGQFLAVNFSPDFGLRDCTRSILCIVYGRKEPEQLNKNWDRTFSLVG
jgi:hypothetical protein